MLLFTYRKVVYRPTPTAKPEGKKHRFWQWFHRHIHILFFAKKCNWLCSPRVCWRTSLAHNMIRKGKLFWSQRMRQRSSDNELLGSESRSASGGSSSVSELERRCARLRPCGWQREWLWELILHLLAEEPSLDSPLLTCTRTSLLSESSATAAPRIGALVTSSGCRFKVKPPPAWAPSSFRLGCITAGDTPGFSACLQSLLKQIQH